MPNLYWKNIANNNSFNDITNWFTNSAATIQAAAVPWVYDGGSTPESYVDYDLRYAVGQSAISVVASTAIGGMTEITGNCYIKFTGSGLTIYSGTFLNDVLLTDYSTTYGGTFSSSSMTFDVGDCYGGTFYNNTLDIGASINAGIFNVPYLNITGGQYVSDLVGSGIQILNTNASELYFSTLTALSVFNSGNMYNGSFYTNTIINDGSIESCNVVTGRLFNYNSCGSVDIGTLATLYNTGSFLYGSINGTVSQYGGTFDSIDLTITGSSSAIVTTNSDFTNCNINANYVIFNAILGSSNTVGSNITAYNAGGATFNCNTLFLNGAATDCIIRGSNLTLGSLSNLTNCNVNVNGMIRRSGSTIVGGFFDTNTPIYYRPTINYSWNTINNWYTNSNYTLTAGRLPQLGESVYLTGEVRSLSGTTDQIAKVVAGHPSTGGGGFRVMLTPALPNNPNNEYQFYGSTVNHTTLTAAKFYQTSANGFTLSTNQLTIQSTPSMDSPAIATSSNAQYVFILPSYGSLTRSQNEGNTWGQISLPGGASERCSICCSYTGQYVYISKQFDYMLKSTDYGLTFSQIATTDILGWNYMCCSSSGQHVYVTQGREYPSNVAGNIYYSSDYGTNWSAKSGAGSRIWMGIACSSSGQIVYGITRGAFFKSSDYGTTWTQLTSITSNIYVSVCCSSDGQTIYVANGSFGSGPIYKSTNGGTTWSTPGVLAGIQDHQQVRCSANGSIVVATYYSTGFLYSNNGGTTWTYTKSDGPRYFSVALGAQSTVSYTNALPGQSYKYDPNGIVYPTGVITNGTFNDSSNNSGIVTKLGIFCNTNSVGTVNSGIYGKVYVENGNVSTSIYSPLCGSYTDNIHFNQLDVLGTNLL